MKVKISTFEVIMNDFSKLNAINKKGIEPTEEEVNKKVKEIFPEELTNSITSNMHSIIDSLFAK